MIPPEEKIPLFEKLAFSVGGKLDYVSIYLTTSVLWMPFFNIGLGISPAILAGVLMVLRLWDGFADPIMGNITDNARTRWGRRRPFIAVGAVFVALIYPFLWRPPSNWGEWGMAAYLTVMGVLFFTAYTCWSMPYYGLQMELTPNYDERTRLTAWMALVSKVAAVFGGWLLAFLTSPIFKDPQTGKTDIVSSMQTCSWYIAAIILILGVMPALFVKERFPEGTTAGSSRESFLTSLIESSRSEPLWVLIATSFFLLIGSTATGSLGQYVNIYYINAGNLSDASIIEGWRSTGALATGLLSIPFWTWICEKLDKKRALILLFSVAICGQLLYLVCLRPDMPYLQILPAILLSSVLSAFWLILPSMKADVADYDEMATSRRREGSLNAFYSWFVKMALTLGIGASGLLFQITGFNVKQEVQTPETLAAMVNCSIFVPIVFWLLALTSVFFYPLSRDRMADIRMTIEANRGKTQPLNSSHSVVKT